MLKITVKTEKIVNLIGQKCYKISSVLIENPTGYDSTLYSANYAFSRGFYLRNNSTELVGFRGACSLRAGDTLPQAEMDESIKQIREFTAKFNQAVAAAEELKKIWNGEATFLF